MDERVGYLFALQRDQVKATMRATSAKSIAIFMSALIAMSREA